MRVSIKALTFETIIGILPQERLVPQKVIIEVLIDYDYDPQSKTFINYAEVALFIEKTVQKEAFELIETALLVLIEKIKAHFPLSKKISLSIAKPDIIDNCSVSVSLERSFL